MLDTIKKNIKIINSNLEIGIQEHKDRINILRKEAEKIKINNSEINHYEFSFRMKEIETLDNGIKFFKKQINDNNHLLNQNI